MSAKQMENLKEALTYELDGIAKKGEITKDTLDNVYKLVKSIKGLDTIIRSEGGEGEYSYGEYSRYMPYGYHSPMWSNRYDGRSNDARMEGGSHDGSYNRGSYDAQGQHTDTGASNARRGRDGDGDGRYSEDSSYRRGRDARGRYTSRDGYSKHSAKDRVIEHLENMLDDSQNQSEKIAIMRCIDELQD